MLPCQDPCVPLLVDSRARERARKSPGCFVAVHKILLLLRIDTFRLRLDVGFYTAIPFDNCYVDLVPARGD
jgi:hypothetical protein